MFLGQNISVYRNLINDFMKPVVKTGIIYFYTYNVTFILLI